MCICDSSYPRKLAFSYLDELSKEFQRSYGDKIETVTRPYAFMGFGKLSCFPRETEGHTEADTWLLDTFISKTTRLYKDSRALTQGGGSGSSQQPSQLDQLNENLKDVTRIMTKNMEDLLWRGDSLDRDYPSSRQWWCNVLHADDEVGMSHLSTSLRSESAKYRKAARNINLQAMIRKYAPIAGIGLFIILFLYWRFF